MRALPRRLAVLLAAALAVVSFAADSPPYPPKLGRARGVSRSLQRTLRLLATSRPERRNTVRVLFYGQSITEQRWTTLVTDDLRARFPNANLVVENRALGGFASQYLVKTAATDLYSFYPDLLIFHALGAHDTYEALVRRLRERTTAEVLLQNDHVTTADAFTEQTDPRKIHPVGPEWMQFMNHEFLPSLVGRYGVALCDQRAAWKRYLKTYSLPHSALLSDDVHLNAHGEWLMAECVKDCLRRVPALGRSPADDWVHTYVVGRDVHWKEGKLRLPFAGNRVDAIASGPRLAEAARVPAAVTIDGRPPSAWPELYGLTRAQSVPGGKWPPLADISSEASLQLETWTLELVTESVEPERFRFSLSGSRTGPDGTGRTDQRFVSLSKRVVIEPDDWWVAYAMRLNGVQPIPERFVVRWEVVPHFNDVFVAPQPPEPGVEAVVTLAQGLPNASHTLEISGGPETLISALRVYRPPLGRMARPSMPPASTGGDRSAEKPTHSQ